LAFPLSRQFSDPILYNLLIAHSGAAYGGMFGGKVADIENGFRHPAGPFEFEK
jgi:hypothetical protein